MSNASPATAGEFTSLTTITKKVPDPSPPSILYDNSNCCNCNIRKSGYLSSSSSVDSQIHKSDLGALDLAGGPEVPRIRRELVSTAPTSRVGTPTSGKSVRPLPALPSPRGSLDSATWSTTIKSAAERSPSPRMVRPLPLTPSQSPLYTNSLDPETAAYLTSTLLDIVEPVISAKPSLGRSDTVGTKPPTYTPEESMKMLALLPKFKESGVVVKTPATPECSPPASPPSPSRPVLPALSIPTTLSMDLGNHLAPPSTTNDNMLTPVSPSMPQPPTPQTLRKRRLSKLRRHFGEVIPEEIIRIDDPKPEKGRALEEIGENNVYLKAAIAVGKILDVKEEGDESASDEEDLVAVEAVEEVQEDEEEKNRDYQWVLENGVLFQARRHRYSRRWIREQGSRRWEERDYPSIIKALRAL